MNPYPTMSSRGSRSAYDDARKKSRKVFQYWCKCSNNVWWGSSKNNQCRECFAIVEKLPLVKMIGVGWFVCSPCGRRFAGFAQGDVTSSCHGCAAELLPSFIVSGDKVQGEKRKWTHRCSACKGAMDCPIVDKALRMSGKHNPA